MTSITYPSGHIVTYTRASDGKVTSVSAKPSALGSSTNIATSVAYAPFGPLTDLTYGNGLVLERGFDQNYWQNALVVSASGVDRLDLQFTRNANGDLTGVTDNITSGRAATFGYTDASRLSSADGAWGDNGFSWDKAGNRKVTTGAGSPGYREAAGYEDGSNRLALSAGHRNAADRHAQHDLRVQEFSRTFQCRPWILPHEGQLYVPRVLK